jgi:hypothetical protein
MWWKRLSKLLQHHRRDKTQVANQGLSVNTDLCEDCGAL